MIKKNDLKKLKYDWEFTVLYIFFYWNIKYLYKEHIIFSYDCVF